MVDNKATGQVNPQPPSPRRDVSLSGRALGEPGGATAAEGVDRGLFVSADEVLAVDRLSSVVGAAVGPLRLGWPPWQPPPGSGVVAVVADALLATGWADALLARVDEWRYLWVATDAPEARGLEVLSRPGVVAATVAFGGVDVRHLGLALDVACRAAALRRTRGLGGCLTGWLPPRPPTGAVRVPHLVTVWNGRLAVDCVVWEILTLPSARQLLGSPMPDLLFVEGNLHRLMRLRTAARTASLPPTTAAARLLSLLGPERDLPISLVYQRPDLFRALLRPGMIDSYCDS